MKTILKNLIGDSWNFKMFFKGFKDSYAYWQKTELSEKKFKLFCDLITLIMSVIKENSGRVYFLSYGEWIFITINKEKLDELGKYIGLVLYNGDRSRVIGSFLDIPMCCVEKYVSDADGVEKSFEGINPAKRYLKQVKELKIKDKFGVKIKKDSVSYRLFIPCNPKCKEALKIIGKMKNEQA